MDLNPHIKPVFNAYPKSDDVGLDSIPFLYSILPAQQASTPNSTKLGPKLVLFFLET